MQQSTSRECSKLRDQLTSHYLMQATARTQARIVCHQVQIDVQKCGDSLRKTPMCTTGLLPSLRFTAPQLRQRRVPDYLSLQASAFSLLFILMVSIDYHLLYSSVKFLCVAAPLLVIWPINNLEKNLINFTWPCATERRNTKRLRSS